MRMKAATTPRGWDGGHWLKNTKNDEEMILGNACRFGRNETDPDFAMQRHGGRCGSTSGKSIGGQPRCVINGEEERDGTDREEEMGLA
jgi:hypothetical protein